MEETGSKVTSHIVKGVFLAIILIIYSLTGHFTNLLQRDWFFMEGVGIFVAGVIWSVINYAGQLNGDINFAGLLTYGLKLTAVVTCLMFLYSLVELYVFFPNYMDEVVKNYVLRAAKGGQFDKDNYNEYKDQARRVLTTMRFAGTVMGTMIMGLLASLIGGALAKKNPGA